jgi:hypothetical protein
MGSDKTFFERFEAAEPEAPRVFVNASGRLRTVDRLAPLIRNDHSNEHDFLSRLLDEERTFDEMRNDSGSFSS